MATVLPPNERGTRTLIRTHRPPMHPEWEDRCQPLAEDLLPASQRCREELLRELRRVGLGEDQANAEASRLLAGDVWGG